MTSVPDRILNILSRTEPMLVPEIHHRINRDPKINSHVIINDVLLETRLLVMDGKAEREERGYIRTGARPKNEDT